MTVKIVTDSTADLPKEVAESLDITVVPLTVHFGTDEFKDGVDLTADEFYDRLINGPEFPKTSQPSVGDFAQVYERLGQECDGILSVHVSSKVSGTFNSAVQAKGAAQVACPIEVVDTQQATMAVGLVAIAAAKSVQQGAGLEEAAGATRAAAERSRLFVLLDTLEYLEKGGRVGKAGALLGTLLRIRPMVTLRDGVVQELAKARSRNGGIARLLQFTREAAPLDELSVLHSTTPADALALAQEVKDLMPGEQEPIIARAGPVIGTYAGPGALGIAVLRSETP